MVDKLGNTPTLFFYTTPISVKCKAAASRQLADSHDEKELAGSLQSQASSFPVYSVYTKLC